MPISSARPKRDRTNQNFSKCTKSLLKKSNNLTRYQADVYVLIRRKGKIWEYKSLSCDCWPLSSSAVVSTTAIGKESRSFSLRKIIIRYQPRERRMITLRKGRHDKSSPSEEFFSGPVDGDYIKGVDAGSRSKSRERQYCSHNQLQTCKYDSISYLSAKR